MVPESFPKSYNYPNEDENDHHAHSNHSHNEMDVMRHITDDIKPKIMIMGPKRFVNC